MSSIYAELSRVAYETGRKFAEVLAETSRPVVQYDAGLNSRPLCFLHVPKTGGASMIHALDSMFDEAEICPARIFSEFDRLTPAQLNKYKFFRGHLQGCQLQALPSETELFTVLRSPAAYARSMYDFLRQLNPSDWRDAFGSHRCAISQTAHQAHRRRAVSLTTACTGRRQPMLGGAGFSEFQDRSDGDPSQASNQQAATSRSAGNLIH